MVKNLLRSHQPEPKVRPVPAIDPQPPPLPTRASRAWPLFTVMVALGALGLGWWVGARTEPGPARPVTLLGIAAEEDGLATAVPGFSDTLLAVATNGSDAMDLVVWPPQGPLAVRPLPAAWTALTFDQRPFEDFAAFDSSRRQLALASPVAREASATLLAGRLEEVVTVASRVTSYAWHVTRPRSLAYTIEEGGTFVEVMTGAPRIVERVGPAAGEDRLVAWGEWGYLMARQGVLELWGTATSRPGEFIAAGPHGVVVTSEGAALLWDPLTDSVTPLPAPGDIATASLSPDGELVAYASPAMLVIVGAAGSEVFATDWPFVELVTWSTDGRHLIFADRVDVMILDLESGEVTATGLGPSVAVATRPLASFP